ncbi:MAG: hypothetical protein CTY22_00085 [Methylomonas sp.]|nr:MAG: hypothetical protein CTY23_01205 [Methylomonas sp.]PPD27845.1 MAG: hypothetical protein CTY22_00085 [Methylomonas sp.]PPD39954.1 MAG: hypothetical protein CTY21_00085 [Methylomonas sp.]PPD41066.1 MAG: hypothetical protein CTY17_04780 [Methylomonas sp.]PPD52052.1 MAG: hypothetical protein CTY11_10605 [Methylomonas sp.]
MDKKTPIWVMLALSSIKTRKGGLILIGFSLVFTLYCIPWAKYFSQAWVGYVFMIDEWDWFAMMLPMTGWYWLSLRWMDKNDRWETG